MPKKKTEHQKRLHSQRKIKVQREARFRGQPFSFLDFFKTFQLEIFVGPLIVGCLIFIPRWGGLKKDGEGLNASVSSLSEAQNQELKQRFPNGFKLIEIEKFTMKPLEDSLSKDFQINWNNLKLERMDAQKIRMVLPEVLYKSRDVRLTHAVVDFQRRHQELVRFNQGRGLDLLAQMISDDGEKVVCLFSFEVGEK